MKWQKIEGYEPIIDTGVLPNGEHYRSIIYCPYMPIMEPEDILKRPENKMKLNEYQEGAIETAIYGAGHRIVYPTLGLAGEAGELANKVKKVLRDNNGEFSEEIKEQIMLELSDCLWYVAALATDLGYTLEEIARENLEKLRSRKERNVIGGSGDNR